MPKGNKNNKKYGYEQQQTQLTVSAYEAQTIYDTFRNTLEWLEKYIEKANYYHDWQMRKQIHDNVIKQVAVNNNSLSEVKNLFSTVLFGLRHMIRTKPSFIREELEKEFSKWLDGSGINVDNCPDELVQCLVDISEVLEGRGEEFAKERIRQADENIDKLSKEEWRKGMSKAIRAYSETLENEQVKAERLENKTYKDVSFGSSFVGGDAERGKNTFRQIVKKGKTNSTNLDKIVKEVKENPQFWRLDDETPTETGYFGRAKKQEWLLIRWDARLDDYDHGKLNFDNNPIYRWKSFNAHQRFEIKVALNISVNYSTEEEIKWIVEEVKENPSIWLIGLFKGHNCLIHGLAQGNDDEIGTLIHSQQKFSDLEWKEINKTLIMQNINEWEFRDVVAFNGIFNDGTRLTKYDNERWEKVFIKKSVQIGGHNDYDNQGNLLPKLGKIYRESDFNREQWTEIQNVLNFNSETHPNYDNWTKEQFIAEINRLNAEIESLKNNQTLNSSERAERIQQNQQRLNELTSYVNDSSKPNNSNSSFPTGWIIGGGLLSLVGLVALLIVRNSKKKRKLSR